MATDVEDGPKRYGWLNQLADLPAFSHHDADTSFFGPDSTIPVADDQPWRSNPLNPPKPIIVPPRWEAPQPPPVPISTSNPYEFTFGTGTTFKTVGQPSKSSQTKYQPKTFNDLHFDFPELEQMGKKERKAHLQTTTASSTISESFLMRPALQISVSEQTYPVSLYVLKSSYKSICNGYACVKSGNQLVVFQRNTGNIFLNEVWNEAKNRPKLMKSVFVRFVGSLDRDKEVASVLLLKFRDRESALAFLQELREYNDGNA
jgi:hypothetical protein